MRVIAAVAAVAVLLAGAAASGPPADPLLARVVALARAHPEIWTGAGLTRHGHVAILGGATALRADLAARAERARAEVARVWGPVDAVVLVPATTAQAAVLAAPADVAGLAAVAAVDHVVLEPRAFARLSPAGRQVVLTHELTHVATRAAASDLPAWLIEGFADYVGYRGSAIPVRRAATELAAEVRAGRLPAALPTRADFDDDRRRVLAYEEAWLACRFIAARFGEERLVRLYRREVPLGMSIAAFTAAWREYVRGELT